MSNEYVVEFTETRTRADLIRTSDPQEAAEIVKAMHGKAGAVIEVAKVTRVPRRAS